MQKLKHIILLCSLWVLASAFTGLNPDISAAFKSGSAFKVSAFFQDQVDLTILESSDLLSKLEAERKIYDFFHEHSPTNFEILHEVESNSGPEFTIGKLTTKNGTFRVSIYVNKTENSEYIQQIIIDAE